MLDTCDNPLYTAEQSLDLLQGFMYRKVKNIHKDVVCTKDSIKNILGIIGAQTSEVYTCTKNCTISKMTKCQVSLEIARLGRIFHVPQVSYLSTAVVLSNKELYPYFFRTVPSDTFQAKVSITISDSNQHYLLIHRQ